jgi:hypothetical protein
MYKYIGIFALLLLFWACDKREPEPSGDVETLVGAPLQGQVYPQGDTIFLKADMSAGNWTMHAYEIYVYDSANVYFSTGEHLHELIYEIDTFFVNRVNSSAKATVEFRLHMDHKGDRRDVLRAIELMP